MNKYFSAVFFGGYFFTFEQLVNTFKGKLFFRAFGRDGEIAYESSMRSIDCVSILFYRRLLSMEDRYFFAQAYPFLSEIEKDINLRKSLTLPIGLSEEVMQQKR